MYLIRHSIDNSHCILSDIVQHMQLQQPTRNKYDVTGLFHRIYCKDNMFISNSFQAILHIKNAFVYKQFVLFPIEMNRHLISQIYCLEYMIFQKYNMTSDKIQQSSIYSSLLSGCVKTKRNQNGYHHHHHCPNAADMELLLQISGIWETHYARGLVYTFIITMKE